MVRAFILVKTSPGEAAAVAKAVHDQAAVEEAHVVAGQYDVIVEAVGEEVYDVIDGVATGLRDVTGVADTRTYICLE
ncbi:Lrp/AsnC ligand binding domain-containing protein [Salinirussus salinus]|jgi:DNA-binding Lrp family transcriptional regulator|uniref:Lrp/AsnC ligand binding domain-containing protein n=1 Tax=Salinirussus salinus TaxID=1198300 RepID=UPI00135B865C|nr:Lrp/AsnC ligand binding domain-containing protein [Salinirussus salinus]